MGRDPGEKEPIRGEIVDPGEEPIAPVDELPVVARLVVEIRSDGRRTIARGAMEDIKSGQKVAIEAKGSSPLELALALAKTMLAAPALVRTAAQALLPERAGRKRQARSGWGRWRRRRRR